ncbi:MAG: hypothetical protein PSN34_06375 [Urechidicola sp.]|nr:hypothetical protein [Urechidicola sp.]
MRATKYFKNSTDMAIFAAHFTAKQKSNWYIRTTLRCDHVLNQRRKAIVLVTGETIRQRLITCKVCNTHGNAVDVKRLKTIN